MGKSLSFVGRLLLLIMAKLKLRKIVIDGESYLWRFQPGYKRTENPGNPYRCSDCFVAFLEGNVTSPLRIMFDTWECSIVGGPLRCGAPIDLNFPESGGINLHTPRWAALLIRAGIQHGWKPHQQRTHYRIDNGVELLEEMRRDS